MFCYKITYDRYYQGGVGNDRGITSIVISPTNSITDIEESQEMKVVHPLNSVYYWTKVTHAEFLGECQILTPQVQNSVTGFGRIADHVP